MPFVLHPSGYCSHYDYASVGNLLTGAKCPECKRVAGHSATCSFFRYDENKGKSSRGKLYDATAVLWAKFPTKNFLTFTLPSLQGGTYQRDVFCPESGDIEVSKKFSKVLEAWSKRTKRNGQSLSYTWVAEAQTKRKQKYGGIGDIHFHVVANVLIKNDRKEVVDLELLHWLQSLWCSHVGVSAENCLHVDPLPDGIRSIPAYLCKYMGKGATRRIVSRQFGATRDLTRYKPITFKNLPADIQPLTTHHATTGNGYEITTHYFESREVLELYGEYMALENDYTGSRTGKQFTPERIMQRAVKRQWAEIARAQNAAGTMGLSYST